MEERQTRAGQNLMKDSVQTETPLCGDSYVALSNDNEWREDWTDVLLKNPA